ncbi:MAG: response regulator [Bdellovibrionales bacterium]|nr:response regulator [Bdellovibrionales bacterium]
MFPANTRILVVDDMMTMRKLVIKALKEMGFSDFIEAGDGAKGWEALSGSTVPVGIVVSDWNMPGSTGIDLLKRVRAESRFKGMPFFLLTAEAEAQQVAEAIKAGVSGYVVKPFTVESLKIQFEATYKKMAA